MVGLAGARGWRIGSGLCGYGFEMRGIVVVVLAV